MELRDILFLIFTLICMVAVFRLLKRYEVKPKNSLIIVPAWLVVISVLGWSGVLDDFSSFPPRMVSVLIFPLLLTIWFIISSRSDRYAQLLPAAQVVRLQSFRVIVELFLWWGFIDQIVPQQMTFEGRNFDILVGLTAPLVSWYFLKEGNIKPVPVLIWNILGLALLVNIVTIAVLSMPTPMRYFTNEPANTIVAGFPWVLLPGCLVILAFLLHLLSIKQMVTIMRSR